MNDGSNSNVVGLSAGETPTNFTAGNNKGSSGNGGDDGGPTAMEIRVDKLRDDMSDLRVGLAKIEGKLNDMPTKDFMTLRLVWVASLVLTLGSLLMAGISFFVVTWGQALQ